MCVVKLKARREQVRGKIPDMTGRKRGRSARKTLFRAELMDFLFFHADQQKMIFRNKSRTETFRGSTEFYGAVRRGTEGYGEIRYLIFAAVAIFVSVVAASNYPLRISPLISVNLRTKLRSAPSDQSDKSDGSDKKTLPCLTAPAQGRGGSRG